VEATPVPAVPVRPDLVRPLEGRMVAGVAAGVAVHLGWPARVVRIVFVLLAGAGGAGIGLYLWLWALVPSRAVGAAVPDGPAISGAAPSTGVRPGGLRGQAQAPDGVRSVRADLLLGGGLLLAGLVLLGSRLGVGIPAEAAVPLLVVLAGAVLAYSQLDEVERSRWAVRTGVGTQAALLRVAGGVALVVVGVLLVVVQSGELADVGRALFAAVAVLAGAGLVLAPWGVRLWRDLDAERAARAREAERADIAAHLHDSVLQTLAMIQRSADDPVQVGRLARAQERDLRAWLYDARSGTGEATLAAAVRAAVAEVEDRRAAVVEVVVVGDRPLDERSAVLVAALREAVFNAARHAGGTVQVYVEAGMGGVEAFVRDRGRGFDLAAVPGDRLGVRESIVGRTERAGGTARVRSDSGGTEVRLTLPDLATAGRGEDPPGNGRGQP